MLVDPINHRFAKGITETTVLGPFYVQNAPEAVLGDDIRGDAKGEPLYVHESIVFYSRRAGHRAGRQEDRYPWRRLHSDFVLAKAAQKKSVPAA